MAAADNAVRTADGGRVESDLSLSDGTLRWSDPGGGRRGRCLSLEDEVLGAVADGDKLRVRAFVEAPERASFLSCCVRGEDGGGRRRVRGEFVLEMVGGAAAAKAWEQRIRRRIDELGRPKNLFIMVNPFGGKGFARKIFLTKVKPFLEDSGIVFTMQETKHRFHAQELTHSLDLTKFDGIVCVSGDGILVEVVNGLLLRNDWETAIKMPLGLIPAGSGNGMVKSLLHAAGDTFSISNALFAIVRGHKRALDVTSVVQGETKFFSVLMLSWGLVADIDIESERYRWLGSARFDFYSLLRVLNLRKYRGQVLFVPAPGYEEFGAPVTQMDELPKQKTMHHDNSGVQSCSYQGPSINLDDLQWRSLDGPFISVWINNVPWGGENIMPAPDAKFSDGYLDAVIILDCPKLALLGLLLKMSDGSYVKSPYVLYFKVKALMLEPGLRVGSKARGGIIDSDGEVIAKGDKSSGSKRQEHLMAYGPPIQLMVDQGLATIFSPR